MTTPESQLKNSKLVTYKIPVKFILTIPFLEYGTGSKVSPYGDVYACGIFLLEMFTGKRPTDSLFVDGLDLHKFVKNGLPDQITNIIDPILLPSVDVENENDEEEETIAMNNIGIEQLKVDQMQECLISILRIGVACSVESARERMDIRDVIKELQLIKDILRASGMTCSSVSQ